MVKRLFCFIYHLFIISVAILIFAGCIYKYGPIGFFTAIGVLLTIIFIIALLESFVKWIALGVWEFPTKEKDNHNDA